MAIRPRNQEIEMTAANMQLAFYRSERRRFELLVANVFIKGWLECDLVGVRLNGHVDEVEIKVSRSDFKSDFCKVVPMQEGQPGAEPVRDGHLTYWQAQKHSLLAAGHSAINRFWFMSPAGMLTESDLPDHAGLIEVARNGAICVIKQAPLLHRRKADDSFRYNCLRQQGWRVWEYMTGQRANR